MIRRSNLFHNKVFERYIQSGENPVTPIREMDVSRVFSFCSFCQLLWPPVKTKSQTNRICAFISFDLFLFMIGFDFFTFFCCRVSNHKIHDVHRRWIKKFNLPPSSPKMKGFGCGGQFCNLRNNSKNFFRFIRLGIFPQSLFHVSFFI